MGGGGGEQIGDREKGQKFHANAQSVGLATDIDLHEPDENQRGTRQDREEPEDLDDL
jgi:hypothetical protein